MELEKSWQSLPHVAGIRLSANKIGLGQSTLQAFCAGRVK
jgi:hypothetical protein